MAEGGGGLDIDAFIDALCVIDAAALDRSRLGELALEATRLSNAVLAYASMVHDAFDREGDWSEATSSARWVANRTGSDPRVIAGRVRDGATLRLLPRAATLARTGHLSSDHVRSLTGCVAAHPDAAVRDEDVLVTRALAAPASVFRTIVRRWIDETDADADQVEPRPKPVSELSLTDTADGGRRPGGYFTAEDAALLDAALDAGVDRLLRAAHDGDPAVAGKPVSALRAQALLDLIAQSMRREPSDRSVPDRYRVPVIVPAEAHCSPPDGAQPTEPPVAWCDSTMFRAVIDAKGTVLDIGRDTPRWSTPIRRAITLRDGHCVFPGCDRPPSWCDVHHCQPWEHGGHTKVDNGALLCRSHHTFLHANRWTITFHERKPQVRRPDGSLFTIARLQTDALGLTHDSPVAASPAADPPGTPDGLARDDRSAGFSREQRRAPAPGASHDASDPRRRRRRRRARRRASGTSATAPL